ncbi:MAG: MTH1187 family thiamine-binding protein [Candidatus Latescibacterota bacterium]
MSGRARMEIAVYPLGTGDASVSREVSRIFEALERCGLTYQITVMGTVVEGTVDELFTLARELHTIMFSDTVQRVVTVLRIDERISRE